MRILPPCVAGLCALAWGMCGPATARPSGEKPNVLLILADDQGWGDVGFHGNSDIDTPALDTLAGRGLELKRFHVCPSGAPTRASLLTGRYHYRTGVAGVSPGEEVMHAAETTIAELFREAGYATACLGKWHNGANWPHNPNGQGFDEFLGFCGEELDTAFDAVLEKNGAETPTRGWVTDVLTDAAVEFVARSAAEDRPFLCHVAFSAPHSPYQAPDALFEKYRARGLGDRTAAVYAMVESIDGNVRRLLDAVEAAGQTDNTVVWYLSDNGPALRPDDPEPRFNGYFYGAKGGVHEGGVRVPSIVAWPGRVPAGSSFSRISAHIDVLPTLAGLCGVEMPEGRLIDGMDLTPALVSGGQPRRWPNRILFTSWTPPGFDTANASRAVRTDRWLAARDAGWRRAEPAPIHSGWELYDLSADPLQRHELGDDYKFLLADMRADYARWLDETTDYGLERFPTEIGYPEWPVVTLRAREAVVPETWEKQMKRGDRTWLTHWSDPSFTAGWPTRVVGEGGSFTVEIEYSLPEANAPCGMRLRCGGSLLDFTVSEPFASETVATPDRVPRREPGMRTSKRLAVGEIDLSPGDADLTIGVTRLKGGSAIDLLALRLRRKSGP
ncbi:MAG: arylsulfatase [Akkermansiaceae bacterium]|nr:arylsulfatase [Akkermansiaceae bacterium]MCP5551887.1 arylsulfatase [Akkermansiaceae bacterium]